MRPSAMGLPSLTFAGDHAVASSQNSAAPSAWRAPLAPIPGYPQPRHGSASTLGYAGSAAAVMAGKGAAPVRQRPDAAGADGFSAGAAMDYPAAVAAIRTGIARP